MRMGLKQKTAWYKLKEHTQISREYVWEVQRTTRSVEPLVYMRGITKQMSETI